MNVKKHILFIEIVSNSVEMSLHGSFFTENRFNKQKDP